MRKEQSNKDLCNILEITGRVDHKTLKKQYKTLALLHHPDKNNNSEESTKKFSELVVAYGNLSEQFNDRVTHIDCDHTTKRPIDLTLDNVEVVILFFIRIFGAFLITSIPISGILYAVKKLYEELTPVGEATAEPEDYA
jgi:hypothetical protein